MKNGVCEVMRKFFEKGGGMKNGVCDGMRTKLSDGMLKKKEGPE